MFLFPCIKLHSQQENNWTAHQQREMRSFNSDGVIRVAQVETRSVSSRTSNRPIKTIYRRLNPSCQGLGSLCFMLRHSTNQQAKLEVVYLVTVSYTQRQTQHLSLPVFVLRFQVVMVLVMALIQLNIIRPSIFGGAGTTCFVGGDCRTYLKLAHAHPLSAKSPSLISCA